MFTTTRKVGFELNDLRLNCLVVCLLALVSCSTPSKLVRTKGIPAGGDLSSQCLDAIAAAPDSENGRLEARRFLRVWQERGQPRDARFGGWRVVADGDYPPSYFDSLLPAEDFRVEGFQHRHLRSGTGVPLVGHRHNSGREPAESFYPPEGICRPVTAVFKAGPGKMMRLNLADPLHDESLAADFTAPLASLLTHTGVLAKMGFTGLMGGRHSQERGHRLYLMEPYDPNKIPVIFVHGLLSTPLTWAEFTNDVWGDAEFRRRHQVWHYLYPTSAPFLYSARLFRKSIDETQRALDPKGKDPASRHLDIVAHSMGGLLTRTLITDSGDGIWNEVFLVPPEQVKASPDDREQVLEITGWRARRDVRRVILIATPHRGSNMSRSLIGRIGDKLTGLPISFTGLYARLHRENPHVLRPEFRDALSKGKLTSIDTLSPEHPMLDTLLTLPISPKVEIHSIIGNRGKAGPLEESSDGVVPYSSSHLDYARSELIVPTGHGAMKSPLAVREVLRILTAP